jgi:hypothetical protein
VIIPLTHGKCAVIDEADRGLADGVVWRAMAGRKTHYVWRSDGGSTVLLHRLILGADAGQSVDHINGDGLDCRRSNLRLCTTAENLRNRGRFKNNTSGQTGVHWDKIRGHWCAMIAVDRLRINLGRFDTLASATSARLAAEVKYFGAFAPHVCRGNA